MSSQAGQQRLCGEREHRALGRQARLQLPRSGTCRSSHLGAQQRVGLSWGQHFLAQSNRGCGCSNLGDPRTHGED